MKKYTAFFCGEHLRYNEKNSKVVFNLGLLVYDRIYARIFNYRNLLNCHTLAQLFNSGFDGNTMSFVCSYLESLKLAKTLINKKVIRSIYQDTFCDFQDDFIKKVFQDPIFQGEYTTACPSAEIFQYVYENFEEPFRWSLGDRDILRGISLLQDIIFSEYFRKKYNMNTIYATSHLKLIECLEGMPVYSFSNPTLKEEVGKWPNVDFSTNRIAEYFDNTQKLFSFSEDKETREKQNRIELLYSEIVPDFSAIPPDIIYKIKRKDRFHSLPVLSEKLSVSKDISKEDLIKYFTDELWKFANSSMRISVPEIVFDILGWIPVDPSIEFGIQLFSQSKDFVSMVKKCQNNGWIVPIYKLRNEAKKYYMMGNKSDDELL